MWRKSFLLFLLFSFLFAGLAQARGFSDPTFDMDQLKMNNEVIYEYKAPLQFILTRELDRIQAFFKKMADALHAVLIWDSSHRTISLIKPDVQMVTATTVGKKEDRFVIAGPFSKVKKGEFLDSFYVYTEVENLPDEDVELRLDVDTPGSAGKDEFKVTPGVVKNSGEDAWISFQVSNARFNQAGSYKFRLQMKIPSLGETFYTIAEKKIESR
ncbi:hypothetical protein [Thermicanus aegyptius]|uniref:hypothetical protein n=1 Tax=Thermicanus aegyptius TaxID=94009 RepID=UPI0004167EB4|nr:hypothetical protein [Thermicanus aegyptius]